MLQEPHDALVVDVREAPEAIVTEILETIGGAPPGAQLMKNLLAKIRWKLLPFLFLLYVVAYLDRINVSFAALTMNKDIGLEAWTYGLSSTAFYLGYVVFEVPSNLVMEKVGARLWLARIMITWGLASAATAAVVASRKAVSRNPLWNPRPRVR